MDHEKTLLRKYLDGQACPDEKRQLLEILRNSPEAKQKLQSTYDNWAGQYSGSFAPYPSLDQVLTRVSRKKPVLFFPALAMMAAAVVAVFFVVGPRLRQIQSSPSTVSQLYAGPDSDLPVVLLPDGSQISSDAVEPQVSFTHSGIMVDGKGYQLSPSARTSCMIAIPYGCRGNVQLADGSIVRMNSHSRMIVPTLFGKERKIYMTGEALFDVSRDESRPFVVACDDVRVRVLGTRFLVSGTEEGMHKVALISGSVNVSHGRSNAQSVTLAPNQMYTVDDNGKLYVGDVTDWHGLLDWFDGVYRADGTSMNALLSDLSRYYGEKVVCDSRLAGITCAGTLFLKPNFRDMLSDMSGFFSIRSRKQGDIWFVTLSDQ